MPAPIPSHADRPLAGIALRIGSVASFATMGAVIKLAEGRGANLAELLFFRQAAALPVVIIYIAFAGGLASLKTRRMRAHALRSTMGLTSMTAMFATLTLLPLAEATTLNFTVPIFATVLAALVLREPVGAHRWSAVAIGFAGIVIVAQPGSGAIPVAGAITGLTAALLSAGTSILLRHISATERPATTVFWFSTLSLIPLAPIFALAVAPHDPATWLLLALVGLTGGVGQLFMTSALRLAPVSVVLPIDYTALIWATAFGWLLFDRLPGAATWIGAPLIIGSGLYIVWREHRLRRAATPVAAAVE